MNIRTTLLTFLLVLPITSCTTTDDQQKESSDGFTFAFLTDIHVEYGKNADKGLEQVISHVNEAAPDFVLTGGDLVADALGQNEEYATKLYNLYLEKAKALEMPVYNSQGNHEEFGIYKKSGVSPDHPLYGDGMYEELVGDRYYAFDHKGWRFYVLDGVAETENRRYYGYIDSVQMEWLKKDIAGVDAETPIVISTHIPFLTAYAQIKEGSMAANPRGLVVENAKEVLDLFSQHNLRLVLQGHLHMLEDIYANGIHFITGGAVSAGWWNGPINGIEEGYLLVHDSDDDVKWEYVDFGWEVE